MRANAPAGRLTPLGTPTTLRPVSLVPSSSGLGHQVLTLETRVRLPLGSPLPGETSLAVAGVSQPDEQAGGDFASSTRERLAVGAATRPLRTALLRLRLLGPRPRRGLRPRTSPGTSAWALPVSRVEASRGAPQAPGWFCRGAGTGRDASLAPGGRHEVSCHRVPSLAGVFSGHLRSAPFLRSKDWNWPPLAVHARLPGLWPVHRSVPHPRHDRRRQRAIRRPRWRKSAGRPGRGGRPHRTAVTTACRRDTRR